MRGTHNPFFTAVFSFSEIPLYLLTAEISPVALETQT